MANNTSPSIYAPLVTMDFSDSMYAIVKAAFPNAIIVIDCFHIVKRQAVSGNKKNEREFNRKKAQRAKARILSQEASPKERRKTRQTQNTR